MNIMVSFVAILLLLAATHVSCLDLEQKQRIQQFIEEFLSCSHMPGLSLGVVKDGISELITGYGYTNIVDMIPVTGQTLFNIASTSKAFTTILLSKQLADTQYSWNTPVREILGEDFHFYNGHASNTTMLRDLVAHKTGIPRHDFIFLLNVMSREELTKRLRLLNPVFPPRTQLQYTNTMYVLTGHVSEHLAGGTDWEDLIEEYIFQPLNMTASTFTYRDLPDLENYATPHEWVDGELRATPWQMYMGAHTFNPAGGISSNAEDMTKWMNYILGYGPPEMNHTWATATFAPEMVSTNVPYFVKPEGPYTMVANNYYARGWYAGYYKGYKTYNHAGDYRGFHTYVYIVPDFAIGIFHTCNLFHTQQQREMISAFVLDVLLDEQPWFTAQNVCDVTTAKAIDPYTNYYDILHSTKVDYIKTSKKAMSAVSWAFRVEEYIGQYGNFYYGNVTITETVVGEVTFLNLLLGDGDYILLPDEEEIEHFQTIGNNELSKRVEIGSVVFGRDDAEAVVSLTIGDLETMDPTYPHFVRGLKQEDAPPPDIHSCT